MRISRIAQARPEPELQPADLSRLDNLIQKHRNKKGNLIPLLQGVQDIYGYLPKEAMFDIAEKTGLKLSNLYGVATFYAQFRMSPVGKYIIKVCHGTACHVQNANVITEALQEALKVKDGETTDDMLFTLESVACLGCCSLAPVMAIGDETYGKLSGSESVKIIRNIKISEKVKGNVEHLDNE